MLSPIVLLLQILFIIKLSQIYIYNYKIKMFQYNKSSLNNANLMELVIGTSWLSNERACVYYQRISHGIFIQEFLHEILVKKYVTFA